MRGPIAALGLLAALGGCATAGGDRASVQRTGVAPVEVSLIAFNDFHGNLQPPGRAIDAPGRVAGETVRVPAGGVAYLASAIGALRRQNPNNLVVAAGDLVGASPLVSNLFLDEPTIAAMNLIDIDYVALGNHEFDRGRTELLRLANGGCERHTPRQPCAVDPQFGGADFEFLAANTVTDAGGTLFPGYAIRSFGSGDRQVQVAIIGLTLEATSSVVTPAGIAGLTFRDEADTVNALIPRLEAEGADAIVVLIHQGAGTEVGYNDKSCRGLNGDLLEVLDRLSPAVDVVISGHTHNAYVCDYGRTNPQRPFLLTSGGQYGTLLTNIRLQIDPASGAVVSKTADNLIVQGEGFTGSSGAVAMTDLHPRYQPDAAVAALVSRYAAAAEPRANRPVGRLTAPALRETVPSRESVLGNLIADAQLAATRAPDRGGAQIAFMNPGGVRADIVPAADGGVTYGQLFSVQPFGNALAVKSFTGRQIKALLEQQFDSGSNSVERPNILFPSAGFTYGYDSSRPAGQRVMDVRLNGTPLADDAIYRVAMSSFLASGGDNFTLFREGTDQVGGVQDVDALEAYVTAASPLAPPATDRIRNLRPQ